MKFNPDIHHRKSIRLKDYDYSQAGLYFITICINDRSSLFGKIINNEMFITAGGYMVANQWLQLFYRFESIVLHEYVVMPNHFHGILELTNRTGIKPTPTVGDVIGAFKSLSTNEYIKNVKKIIGNLLRVNYGNVIIMNILSVTKHPI